MSRVRRSFHGFAVLALAACGSSARHDNPSNGGSAGMAGTGGGIAGGGGTSVGGAAAFCPRWLDEFSSFMERCSCAADAIERYRQTNAVLCGPQGYFGSVAEATARGDLVYDSRAADALFARLREADAPCVDEAFRALRLDSVEILSLAGVFVGTRPLGAACTLPGGEKGGVSDCREGLCFDFGGSGACVRLAGPGETCLTDSLLGPAGTRCHDRVPVDVDGEYASAFRTLACVPSQSDQSIGTCQGALETGSTCFSGATCASGVCREYMCQPKSATGEPCDVHNDCENGACVPDLRVCGPKLVDGEPCSYDDDACVSGFCNDLSGADRCAAPPSRAIGETCTTSSECISAGSGDSRTRACQGGRCVNDICAQY